MQFDLATVTTIGAFAIGVLGFLFGLFRDHWTRRESRLDALAKALHPLVRTAQDLFMANNCRRKCEQLKHSFPESPPSVIEGIEREQRAPERTPEVAYRLNAMMDEYGAHIKSAGENFRDAEAELGTRHFRFPRAIETRLKDLQSTLSELGRCVNDGLFDKADIQLAKFRDQHKGITDTAKGWRLADPFEGVMRHFRKRLRQEEDPLSEFELTKEEMDGIVELVQKRVTTERKNTFAVHPPQKLIDNMSLLNADTVVDELKDTVFVVVFQDGDATMLSFPELLAFVFNLIVLEVQGTELGRMVRAAAPSGPREYQISFRFSMKEIMAPEMAKMLLSKVSFSDTPGAVQCEAAKP